MGLFQLNESARDVLVHASQYAQYFSHQFTGLEHVLLGFGLTKHPEVSTLMSRLVTDPAALSRDVQRSFKKINSPHSYKGFTRSVDQMLDRAVQEANIEKSAVIDPEHMLLGALWHRQLIDPRVLSHLPMTYSSLKVEISRRGSEPISLKRPLGFHHPFRIQ